MLMDPSFMQVDCQVQNAGEKLSPATYDNKLVLSHDNHDGQIINCNQLNDGKGCDIEELNNSQGCIDEILDGITPAVKSPVNMEFLDQDRQVDQEKIANGENPGSKDVHFRLAACKQQNGSLQEDASLSKKNDSREVVNDHSAELHLSSNQQNENGANHCSVDVDFQQVGCTQQNGFLQEDTSSSKQGDSREEINDLPAELHLPSNPQHSKSCSNFQQDVTATEVNKSCKLNGDASSSQNMKLGGEQIEMNANVDWKDEKGSIDAPHSHAAHEGQHCTLQDLSEIACRIEFGPDKSSPQGENETSTSPNNTTHQPVHNNNCNGNNDDQGEELDLPGNVEQDHAIAFWVKWRGKWQTGIRCPRVDCPLSTLKAKPTHERKRYIAVFFPRSRTYHWVDMLLVRPIEEFPVPLVNGTHRKWRKLVKDLGIPRRYIMQKLAMAMLNFSDELHTEAVIENARKATAWKEFALEASRCRDYIDLGKMLVKLQNMILPEYMDSNWLQNSFDTWIRRCLNAQNAESIEMLTEELRQFVLWKKVEELWNAPVQPELVPEWKTWKQEVMKWFFASHPVGSSGNVEQNNFDDDAGMELQTSRKRPKLEVRRAETYFSQMGDATCILGEDPNRDTVSGNIVHQETLGSTQTNLPCNIGTFPGNFGSQEILESGCANAASHNVKPESDSIKGSRQCSAFIEAKGRQCGRWANDGDIYCCVHLNMHFDRSSRVERAPAETPMCSGMTNLGRQCKHRAQYGSVFCKKHRFQTSQDSMSSINFSSSSESFLQRHDSAQKAAENFSSSHQICKLEKHQAPMQERFIPIVVGGTSDEKSCLMKSSQVCDALPTSVANSSLDMPLCVGNHYQENAVECQEYATRHTLYCEKHLPKFLKRARNGKSRLISKDVFLNLLKGCSSRKQKICLHHACEFLYWFLRSNLSRQRSVLGGDYMQPILSEVSKNPDVGEYLLKLVSSEREKLTSIWGFGADKSKQVSSQTKEEPVLAVHGKGTDSSLGIKCKICAREFSNDHKLGLHWTDVHKREARWLFRGYACAICMDSFTNRKVLEKHVQERHGVQFLQYSTLFRCMSCNSHFVNPEQLWQHVLSFHAKEFRILDFPQRNPGHAVQQTEGTSNKPLYINHNVEKDDGSQKFTCRFCGLKFDLLPDLGRHHQVAHMNPGSISHFPPRRGKYQLNRSRHLYPELKKSLRPSCTLRKKSGFGIQKNFKIADSALSMMTSQSIEAETVSLGKLMEFQCSDVAQALFSKIQKSRSHPSNLEILSIARSSCCRMSLLAALEVKYGSLPENFYLKAAKLCSEMGVQIDWHQEGFICPKGCKTVTNLPALPPLRPLPVDFPAGPASMMDPRNDDGKWEMEEYHYVLDSKQFGWKPKHNGIVLCKDVSFGRERVPIVCVIDDEIKDSLHIKPDELQQHGISVPWEGFNYVTDRLVDPSLIDPKSSLLGCACSQAQCSIENCDHVILFDNDYQNALDIQGKPMHGRFAYNGSGRIILQEGYPIFECNSLCNCDASCQNKVLQKGVQVKLEIFRTEKKGWAVRAAEPIPSGTFVCEYVGEVVKDDDANKSAERCVNAGCNYLFDVDAQIERTGVQSEGTMRYMIDATRYGNVARFINHSCSPNLVTYLVLVENKDCRLAHVGLFTSQDIAAGEELAYDYYHKLLPGDGCPCHCGAQNCRGRLY